MMIAVQRAAFIKIKAILREFTKDRQRIAGFGADETKALDGLGITLTDDELGLLRDVINGTRASKFANPPAGYEDRLATLATEFRQS